jgi:hypothetical protein
MRFSLLGFAITAFILIAFLAVGLSSIHPSP